MRYYVYTRDDGTSTPISALSVAEIQECLADGVFLNDPLPGETVQGVMEQLQIELLARERGW